MLSPRFKSIPFLNHMDEAWRSSEDSLTASVSTGSPGNGKAIWFEISS